MNISKVFLLSFVMLFVCGIVTAQEAGDIEETTALDENVTAQDLNISEPELLPDSPFYFLKTWGREIQNVLTFNPVKKAELREKFANEKLIELKKVVEKTQNAEVIEKATNNYQNEVKNMERAAARIQETAQENSQVGQFLDKFIQQQILHQRVLQELADQVPVQAMEKITEVRERHLEKFGEVMTRLENKENIQERLETNLQQVQGSEFKEFKNLEMLEELKEKAPEAAKEAIQKVTESVLIKLKEKVQQMSTEKIEQFQAYIENIAGEKEKQLEILENLKEQLPEKPVIQQKIMESQKKVQQRIREIKEEMMKEETKACAQVITHCLEPNTGECAQYPDACSTPKPCQPCPGTKTIQKEPATEEAQHMIEKNIIAPLKKLIPGTQR